MKNHLTTLAMTATFTFAAHAASAAVCEDPLTIGWGSYPPFQIEADGGDGPKGIDADVMAEISEITGCEIEWKKRPFKRQLTEVEQGSLDAAAALAKSEDRSEYAKWGGPYVPFNSNLWVNSEVSGSFEDLEAFLDAGHKLGIVRGYEYPGKTKSILDKEAYQDQIRRHDGDETNIKLVAAGRTDGTLGNNFVLGYIAQQEGVADKVTQTDVNVFGDPAYFMFSKKSVSDETVSAINNAIAQLKEDGTIQQIVKEYTGTTPSFK